MEFKEFLSITELFNKKSLRITNKRLDIVFQSYSFYYITEKLDLNNNQLINENIKESKVITIGQYNQNINNNYFIICFKKTIIFIKQSSISFIKELFYCNSDLVLCFLSDSKEKFRQYIHVENKEAENDYVFYEEILNFLESFNLPKTVEHSIYPIWNIIRKSICGYLIKQSYFKHNNDEIDFSYIKTNNDAQDKTFDESEFIELRTIDTGSLFSVILVYHIEKEEIFALKKPCLYNCENQKLITREIENYKNLNYPLIPKFYGVIQDKNYPIIEYINGKTLDQINNSELSDNERFSILYGIIICIDYFHQNELIYRDLKPNNVIIKQNKIPIIIDFDRMIKHSDVTSDTNQFTSDFLSDFIAPEVEIGKATYESDIYSIGKMIYFIFKDRITNSETNTNKLILKIKDIIQKCTKFDVPERISSAKLLIFDFFQNFKEYINTSIFRNNFQVELIQRIGVVGIGKIYYDGKYVTRDINKAIYYFSLAAEQKNSCAEYLLGKIYYEGKYVTRDISKAIYYFSLAAEQEDPDAECFLGEIYYEGKYVTRDVDKAIYYWSLAYKENIDEIYLEAGLLYLGNKNVPRNITKAIYYLTLSAHQNNSEAQFHLGMIYIKGLYIMQDINKAIGYFTLASNQKFSKAQTALGIIFFEGIYVPKNINKAIYYFTLAANQNFQYAQYNLGSIYYEGIHVEKNIPSAIHYLSLAKDIPEAQITLGFLYHDGINIQKNLNKSIYHFSLAANQNDRKAQFLLGFIYLTESIFKQNIRKGINYILISAYNGFPKANFVIGYLYEEGKYFPRDIHKSIQYYKDSSTFNDEFAKNNLGIIYKNGFFDQIQPNIGIAISYFEEAIQLANDKVSMYNLSHIYIYYDTNTNRIDKSIELLIRSYELGFDPSIMLLCIAIIKKHIANRDLIFQEINKYEQNIDLYFEICSHIIHHQLYELPIFEEYYNYFKTIDFMYTYHINIVYSKDLRKQPKKDENLLNCKIITSDFYDGFYNS